MMSRFCPNSYAMHPTALFEKNISFILWIGFTPGMVVNYGSSLPHGHNYPVLCMHCAAGRDMENNAFDAIVSDFYRAATGAISWDQALEGVREGFGARSANVHALDIRRGQIMSMHSGGRLLNEANFNYVKEFHRIDPIRELAAARGAVRPGNWVHCDEFFDDEFVSQNPFYQEFSLAYDIRYNSSVTISIDESLFTGFTVLLPKSRGVLSPDEREEARRLGEHLREALLIHERVRRMAAQALAGHGLLSSFPYPMCLFDKDRFISFENPAVTAEFENETRLRRQGSRLVLARDRSDQQLTEKLLELYQRGHGASAIVDMRASNAGAPTWLHLSLLVPGAVMGVFGEQAQVLATLFDPQKVGLLDPFALANMFQLTPAEAKVAVHLAAGLTPEEISIKNGTAISTIRSQISQVIAKCGVRRAADVGRVLSRSEALWSTAGRVQQ